MIVRSLDEITDTDRDVKTPNWRSKRIVLAKENATFSVHETTLYAGTVNDFWYANHVEAVFVVEGHGELLDKETGELYQLGPGSLYLLDGHEHHQLRPKTEMRTVCVFNPPVTGQEVHDENGVYPLVVQNEAAPTANSQLEESMTLTGVTTEDHYPTRLAVPTAQIERADPTVWSQGADGPIDRATLAAHDSKGYSIIEGLLSPAEVQTYWDELVRLSNDDKIKADERTIVEKESNEVRSIFEVHVISELIGELARDPRVLDRARQILGSEVYIHQSRVNYMPGFKGTGFYWHSDFETWHAEDGMPRPRAVSISIALTENYPFNGGLMVMPGSHHMFVPCVGETPANHYQASLKEQEIGVPSEDDLTKLAATYGIDQFTGPAGSALMFDSNIMHGSGNNITPFPRSNIFMVFNSVENTLVDPFAAPAPRPPFIASRQFEPLRR